MRKLTLACVVLSLSTAASCTKQQARSVDSAVRNACELLAAQEAERTGISVQDIIRTTCAVENVTRDMRDGLLATQRAAAQAAGLAMVSQDAPADD